MVEKTECVVLLTTLYSDTSSIVNVLTADYGRLSFTLSNSRSSRSSVKRSHFQPLNRVELVIDIKQGQNIHRIKESRLLCYYLSVSTNPSKRFISIFLADVLHRIIRNEEYEHEMYEFVVDSLQILELSDDNFENFHLFFLTGLIRMLGFFPQIGDYQDGCYFDLLQGEFVRSSTPTSVAPFDSSLLFDVLSRSYADMNELRLSRDHRNRVLDLLLDYIRKHNHPGIQFKSLDILRSL